MSHKIKLRKSKRTEPVCCPYNGNGLCSRRGCIFKPAMNCMTISQFKTLMDEYYRYRKEKQHEHQRSKNTRHHVNVMG